MVSSVSIDVEHKGHFILRNTILITLVSLQSTSYSLLVIRVALSEVHWGEFAIRPLYQSAAKLVK